MTRGYPKDCSQRIKKKIADTNKVKNHDYMYYFPNEKWNRIKRVITVPVENEEVKIKIPRRTDLATNFKISLLKDGMVIYKNKIEKFLENKCKRCNTICKECVNEDGISAINNIYMIDVFADIYYGEKLIKKFNIFPKDFILPLTMLQYDETNITFQLKNCKLENSKIEIIVKYDGIIMDNHSRDNLVYDYYGLGKIDPINSENYNSEDNKIYVYLAKIYCGYEIQEKTREMYNNELKTNSGRF
jgi:hypothetical protein